MGQCYIALMSTAYCLHIGTVLSAVGEHMMIDVLIVQVDEQPDAGTNCPEKQAGNVCQLFMMLILAPAM